MPCKRLGLRLRLRPEGFIKLFQNVRPSHPLLEKLLHLRDHFLDCPLLSPIRLHNHLHGWLKLHAIGPCKVRRRLSSKLQVLCPDASRQHTGRTSHDFLVGESRRLLHLLCHALNGGRDKVNVTDPITPQGRQGCIELRNGLLGNRSFVDGLCQKTSNCSKSGSPSRTFQKSRKPPVNSSLEGVKNCRCFLHIALQSRNVHAELNIKICNGVNCH